MPSTKFWYIIISLIAVAGVGFILYKSFSTMSPKTQPSDTKSSRQDAYATDPSSKYQFPGTLAPEKISAKKSTIKTKKGTIVFELFDTDAPKTVSNFVYLTEQKFYDGLTFHRVEKGFVIQGGDPNGNGTGGPGYRFVDEPVKKSYTQGIVAMANAGPNTNGSQFFIMLEDVRLPPLYTIFGKVTSGMDVVKKIQIGDKMDSVTIDSR